MGKKAPKIVVIGGGTGTYTALLGLKKYTSNLTAVVSMADSGGSTGRLRDEFGILPPGDVRRALLALSSGDEQLTLRQLFEHRFNKGSGLSGHSFGNLLLTALTDITGSEEKAIEEAGKILNIKGRVLPVTLENAQLCARLEDGTVIKGETNIDIRKIKPELKILDVFLDVPAKIYPQARSAIEEADLAVIGPGDLYTSVIVNLLVEGVSDAVRKTRGKVVYVCNIMNKHGETDGFRASDFVREVDKYLGDKDVVDAVVANESKYPASLLRKYKEEKAFPVEVDLTEVKKVVQDVVVRDLTMKGTLLRHDPAKLAKAIIQSSNQQIN